jgi:hypothetical protein
VEVERNARTVPEGAKDKHVYPAISLASALKAIARKYDPISSIEASVKILCLTDVHNDTVNRHYVNASAISTGVNPKSAEWSATVPV